jgi:hypothetical protein
MGPAKRAAPDQADPIPTDSQITQAIHEFREAETRYRVTYEAMMKARERMVTVLRAAGVAGFSL